jgi:hypothetical protein
VKVTVQVVFDGEDESTEVREVFALERGAVTPDTLGLQLAEAKDLRCAVQETVVDAQVKDTLAAKAACPTAPRRVDPKTSAPSWCAPCSERCSCPAHAGGTARASRSRARPSARWTCLLPQRRSTPELSYLQARFAALASYGMAATLLAELLPLGRPPARHGGPSAGPGRRGAPGRRARPRAAQLHRQLSARPGGAAPPGPPPALQPRRWLRPLQRATVPPGRMVRGDRRQGHPGGRGRPSASGSSRPTTPNPNGACSTCSSPRACKPTRPSPSAPTAMTTSATCRCTSTPTPNTCSTGFT